MNKKQYLASLIMLVLVLVISCAPKPEPTTPTPTPTIDAVVEPTAEVPSTGEASIDEVATDLSDARDIDEELDTKELEDVDLILEDIENI